MILPTDLLYSIYPTLQNNKATNRTCDLISLNDDCECDPCPLYSGNPEPGHGCALTARDNPDLEESWTLFYNEYPEYTI